MPDPQLILRWSGWQHTCTALFRYHDRTQFREKAKMVRTRGFRFRVSLLGASKYYTLRTLSAFVADVGERISGDWRGSVTPK